MKPLITRIALLILAAEAAAIAVPALVAPRAFYDSFPLGASWVAMLPPFNQHLISDVGGFYLAFALLFGWAAVGLRRPLIVPLCIAWAIAALVHFVYHVTHSTAGTPPTPSPRPSASPSCSHCRSSQRPLRPTNRTDNDTASAARVTPETGPPYFPRAHARETLPPRHAVECRP
jgi:hypothetical protein